MYLLIETSTNNRLKQIFIHMLLVLCLVLSTAHAQKRTPLGEFPSAKDSLVFPKDSLTVLKKDSTMIADTIKREGLNAPVKYQAKDSIVMTAANMAFLFGEGNVKYQKIELSSEEIDMNLDSSLVYAHYATDSIGEEFGYPLFKEGEQQYESKTMRYNFRTQKGYIANVLTQQGEGYVIADQTKKLKDNVLNMKGGKYTTCDHYDHPHFYIQMTKAKVRPNKNIVTGPVYLVIEDVPLYPIGLPFCFFPFNSTYSSGIIMPTYGDETSRGFFLRDGGYYFALSDYMDLALTGDIYTKGSWGLNAKSSYRKRYKYSGSFNLSLLTTITGEKEMPDYTKSKDFKLNWTHSQDSKANPYRSLSASVNFSTSSYERNQTTSLYSPAMTQNTKGSSVSITQRFPNNPFTLSANMSINQRSRDSSISVTLPDLSISMTRIYPFKRKHRVGKEKWFEKIQMSYTGYIRNSIDTKENLLLHSSLTKDWQNAAEHTIPISASFKLFKYIDISPSINYKERWFSRSVTKGYDLQTNQIVPIDTTYGFNRVFNYTTSVSASSTLYGFFKPLPIFGDKIQMIRHRFKPSISLGWAPDFGDPSYGYYKTIQYQDSYGVEQDYEYSPFEGQIFSVPGQGKQGNVSFSFDNNVEMKIKSNSDSTGFKKISLIDKLSMNMSYNMAADSFKWSDISVGLRLKFTKNYTLQLNGVFDTYTYKYNKTTGLVSRRNVTRLSAGKGFGRLRSTGTSFSYTFDNNTWNKWFGDKKEVKKEDEPIDIDGDGIPDELTQEEKDILNKKDPERTKEGRLRGAKKDEENKDDSGYYANTFPWKLSINYNMRLNYDTQNFDINSMEYKYKLTHSLSFNGSIQPTKNWRLNFNGTYDFDYHKISHLSCNVSRDLHCFQMTASFIPVGPYKSYSFSIAVKSSLLQDLKYDQHNNYNDNLNWY